MRISLEQALQDVDLRPGQTYRCVVRNQIVEVQVLSAITSPEERSSVLDEFKPESLAPHDAWMELPEPQTLGLVRARPGSPERPDIPDSSVAAEQL